MCITFIKSIKTLTFFNIWHSYLHFYKTVILLNKKHKSQTNMLKEVTQIKLTAREKEELLDEKIRHEINSENLSA